MGIYAIQAQILEELGTLDEMMNAIR